MSRSLALLLAAAVVWLPVAPPEHVHEADEHGHQHLVVHRHTAAHHITPAGAHHDGVFDDDDAPLLTVAAVFTRPAAPPGAARAVVPYVVLPAPVEVPRIKGRADVERLIHGPPRAPTGLRAPPSAARL